MADICLSAADWCFYRETYVPEEYYRRLAALGIAAAEMVDPARMPAARAAGMPLLTLGAPGMTQGLNRRENHDALLPQLRQAILDTKAAGAPYLIVFSGNRDGVSDEAGLANCIDGYRVLAPVAENAGVTLLFEMLCAYDHPGYQADRSAFGFTVAGEVASPAMKVVYDIYHMHRMGEDVLGDILGNLDLIAHLHLAESPRRSVLAPGGEIDYPAIIPAVQDAGYQGYWGLEFIPQGDPLEELARAAGYCWALAN